ncbi:hypothetical protein ACVGVM_06575 [Pseudonocardia bannensis]|uniref:Uncharacterized protein n=1 Tax=Pseudonocardia bannensis TaxID=630973 RepID=A0A848DRB1_9PSEU|nr:hypothetical protein [Pseudonocardia bannensis]NMH95387.1 hypothetical protein [Pseudonocardia bannensis]
MALSGMGTTAGIPHRSAAAILETAAALRWSRPDLTAQIAEHVLQLAEADSDSELWLGSAGWLVHGRAVTGDAREPAADVLEVIQRDGSSIRALLFTEAGARLRVELAGVAQDSGDAVMCRKLVLPLVEQPGVPAELRLDALAVLVRCALADVPERLDDLIQAADAAASELTGPQPGATVALLRAAVERGRRRAGSAAEHAHHGLALLGWSPDTPEASTASGHLTAALASQWIGGLLDERRFGEARSAAMALQTRLARPAVVTRQVAQLRLTVGRATAHSEQASQTIQTLSEAAADAATSDTPGVEAACRAALAELHESNGQLDAALATMRLGVVAERLDRDRAARFRALAQQLVIGDASMVTTWREEGPDVQPAQHAAPVLTVTDAGPGPAVRAPASHEAGRPTPAGVTGSREDSRLPLARATGSREDSRSTSARAAGSREDSRSTSARAIGSREDSRSTSARAIGSREDSRSTSARTTGSREDSRPLPARVAGSREGDSPPRPSAERADAARVAPRPVPTPTVADETTRGDRRGKDEAGLAGPLPWTAWESAGSRSRLSRDQLTPGRPGARGSASAGGDRDNGTSAAAPAPGDSHAVDPGPPTDPGIVLAGSPLGDALFDEFRSSGSWSAESWGGAVPAAKSSSTRAATDGVPAASSGSGSSTAAWPAGVWSSEDRSIPATGGERIDPSVAGDPAGLPVGGRRSDLPVADRGAGQAGTPGHHAGPASGGPDGADPSGAGGISGRGAMSASTTSTTESAQAREATDWLASAIAELDRVWGSPVPSVPEEPARPVEPPAVEPATTSTTAAATPGSVVTLDLVAGDRQITSVTAMTAMRRVFRRLGGDLPPGARLRDQGPATVAVVLPEMDRGAAASWVHRIMDGLADGLPVGTDAVGLRLRATVHDVDGTAGAQILHELGPSTDVHVLRSPAGPADDQLSPQPAGQPRAAGPDGVTVAASSGGSRHAAEGRRPFRPGGIEVRPGSGGRRHRQAPAAEQPTPAAEPSGADIDLASSELGLADLLAGALAAYRGI